MHPGSGCVPNISGTSDRCSLFREDSGKAGEVPVPGTTPWSPPEMELTRLALLLVCEVFEKNPYFKKKKLKNNPL